MYSVPCKSPRSCNRNFRTFCIFASLPMFIHHGRLARWRKWRACDVEEAKEGLENELWHRWSNGRVGEWAVTQIKRRKGWRISCDVGEVKEGLENELWLRWSDGKIGKWVLLIRQHFRHFTYVIAHSPNLLSLLLRHRLFTYVTWRAAQDKTMKWHVLGWALIMWYW